MRARSKKLILPRLSQSNSHNNDGNFWCGRTSACMIYNYYKSATGGSESDWIKNQYDKDPYNLVYPSGKFAAYTDENVVSQCSTEEPLKRYFGSAWDGKYDPGLYPVAGRGVTPAGDAIDQLLKRLLDYLDDNNPAVFASGLTFARGEFVSHFVVISGYWYDDENELWLQINDPATNHAVIKDVLTKSHGVSEEELKRVLKIDYSGVWAGSGQHDVKPEGSLYHVKASVLFKSNPYTHGKPGWNGQEPADALLCDNQYQPGFGVLLSSAKIPDNPFAITEFDVSWPINAIAHDGVVDWTAWMEPDAPFPIGRGLTWHSGVHLGRGAAGDDKVYCFAPGRVVLVRFPKEPPDGPTGPSQGMVLVRHELDPDERRVLKPAIPGTEEKDDVKAQRDRAIPFYSLYMHTGPLADLLDAHGAQAPHTPGWLRKLAPQPIPEPRDFVTGDSLRTYSTWTDAARTARAAVPLANSEKVGVELTYTKVDGADHLGGEPTVTIDVSSVEHLGIPDKARNAKQRDAWRKLAIAPKLAARQGFQYYNPLTGQLVPIPGTTIPTGQALVTRMREVDGRSVAELAVVGGDDTRSFVEVRLHAYPGFSYASVAGVHVEEGLVSFADGTAVTLRVETPAGRSDAATLTGPQHIMRFALARELAKDARPAEVLPQLLACFPLDAAQFKSKTSALATRGAPAPTVPSAGPLQLFNPVTEQLIETDLQLETTVPLQSSGRKLVVVTQVGDVRYVGVPGFAAVLDTAGMTSPEMVISTGDTVYFDGTVTSLPLYIDTAHAEDGQAAKRYFPDDSLRNVPNASNALVFGVKERGIVNKRDRVWLDLVPVAVLPHDQVRTIDSELGGDEQRKVAEIRDRLDAGLSCLFGVELGEKGGWSLRGDGTVGPFQPPPPPEGSPPPPPPEGPPRRIFLCQVEAASNGDLALVHVKGDTDVARWEVIPTPDFSLMPVRVIQSKGVDVAAFIEVFASVPKSPMANNSELRKQMETDNKDRKALIDELRSGKAKDVGGRDLRISREPIGRMGATAAAPAVGPAPLGVHVEVFCGKNLVDPNTAGTDDQLVPVPNSTWMVLRDDDAADAYTPGYIERIYTLLLERDQLGLDYSAFGADAFTSRVIRPSEWQEFASTNARQLAQIVSVHHSLWRPELKDLLDHAEGRGAHLGDDARTAITSEVDRMAFWTSAVTLDGLDRMAPVFHFQPLRFIEWLTTGLDIQTVEVKTPAIRARLGSAPEVTLSKDPTASVPIFRWRTVVGDRRPSARATLTLDGFETSQPVLPIEIKRGGLKRIQVCRPRLDVSGTPFDSSTLDLHFPVSTELAFGGLFLLADGNGVLPATGYSHATVQAVSHFNLYAPTTIKATLSSPTDFTIVGVRPSGDASFSISPASGWGASCEVTVTPLPKRDPSASPAPLFERIGAVTLQIDVAAKTAVDKTTTVRFEASGGDLSGAKSAPTSSIRTRTIKIRETAKGSRARGEDIAKLQLLLSQIPASDHLPCYRASGSSEYGQKGVKKVRVDGQYTDGTARAIWRFCYSYANDTVARWSASVKLTTGKGAPPAPPLKDTVSVDDLKAGTGKDARVASTCPDYPVVDAALISEVIRRFRVPYVVPRAEVIVSDFAIPTTATYPIAISAEWNKTLVGKGAILPCGSDAVSARVRLPDLALIGSSMQVKLELPAASAYKVSVGVGSPAKNVTTTVTAAARGEASFVLSYDAHKLTTAAADNVLKVLTSDGQTELGSISLPGARDLGKKQDKPGRDVALMQLYLSQLKDSTSQVDEPFYRRRNKKGEALVDGRWSNELVQAMDRFKSTPAGASATDFEALATAVRAAYLAR